VELDEFLLKRTVCRIIDADERFAWFKRVELQSRNIKVKVIRSLGAETQLLTWNGSDVILFDTTTVEYANNIYDVMMSAEVAFAERQKAMRSLCYKQWARGLFTSGFSLQSWLLLRQSRKNDARISYYDDTTRISEHIDRNNWETLFSGFLLAHEIGHVLQKRDNLDQERYNKFLERRDQHLPGKVEDLQEPLKRFQDYLQATVNLQVGMTDSAISGIVESVKKWTSNSRRAKPLESRIHDALRVEILCDLYACDFVINNYELGDGYTICYLLPICVEVISFLRIGLANRLWVEYIRSNYEVLRREHGETKAGEMMDAIIEKSYDTGSSLLFLREAGDTVVRMHAISDYITDAISRKRAVSAEGSKLQLKPFKREEILPRFMANVYIPYRHLLLEAFDETNNQWLGAIFSTAEYAEEEAKNGRLDSADLGLPYSRQLGYEELAKAAREQFLRENGF
jgi:hypothetical protein